MTFGSLFAGIGGFDLGFERAGMRCVWQVEIDEYCRRVLAKHWPLVRRWDDVRTWPTADAERPDVICGGFPCQDVSEAGARAGIEGGRSGLYTELLRVVRELRPRFAVLENVSGLLNGGLDRVLGDLAEIGLDADWSVLPACALDFPHSRERVFIVAYAAGERFTPHQVHRRPMPQGARTQGEGTPWWDVVQQRGSVSGRLRPFPCADLPRVADGIPCRVDRLKGLGNAIVPQVAEWIGRRLIQSELFTEGAA